MGIQINGQTDTISATDGSFTISGASGNLTGDLIGNVTGNLTGNVTGNLTGNVNSTGITTFTDLRVGTAVTANSIGVQVGAGKSIRLYGATSGYADIIAAAGSASTTFTLPANGGSASQYLQTDGSGGLSWAAGGKILQVVSTTKTDTFTTTATYSSPDAVTGLSVTIQPSSTSNKILVLVNIGVLSNSSNDNASFVFLAKGGTLISGAQGASPSNRVPCAASVKLNYGYYTAPASFSYLDSPSSTSSLTYQVYCSSESTSTAAINRTGTDSDSGGFPRAISTITAMEVAG